MTKIFIGLSMSLAVAMGSLAFGTSPASAQSGSRLCGISNGPVAMLFEVKQPNSKEGRKKTDKACHDGSNKMRASVPNGSAWKEYKRAECEGVAKDMSKGKSAADICDKMEREKVYTVTYDPKTNAFSFKKM